MQVSLSTTIRVSIVEDNRELREHLAKVLVDTPGYACASTHANGQSALANIPRQKPDVVLMDIGLPDISGIECIRQLAPDLPETKFLVLTGTQDSSAVFHALQAGAHGYLVKEVPRSNLLHQIEQVYQGFLLISPVIAQQILHHFRPAKPPSKLESLTPRETEVLALLAKGNTYKQIADELGCEISTVARHCEHIYRKLHVHSRAEAAAKYFQAQAAQVGP